MLRKRIAKLTEDLLVSNEDVIASSHGIDPHMLDRIRKATIHTLDQRRYNLVEEKHESKGTIPGITLLTKCRIPDELELGGGEAHAVLIGHLDEPVGVGDIRMCFDEYALHQPELKRLIIVWIGNMSAWSKYLVQAEKRWLCEEFNYKLILIDSQVSFETPHYRVLTKTEALQYLSDNDASAEKLGDFFADEIVIRRLGAQIGDIVEVTRASRFSGNDPAHRIVRPTPPTKNNKNSTSRKARK